MTKKQNLKRFSVIKNKRKNIENFPLLSSKTKQWIVSVFLFVFAIIISLSFFDKAEIGGKIIFRFFDFLIGRTTFIIPALLVLIGILFLKPPRERIYLPIFGGMLILILGLSGFIESLNSSQDRIGGILGYGLSWPFLRFFGTLASSIFFFALILVSFLIFWEFIPKTPKKPELVANKKTEKENKKEKIEQLKKVFPVLKLPKLEIKKSDEQKKLDSQISLKEKNLYSELKGEYKVPPIDFFSYSKEIPLTEDIKTSSFIIQKTLANFGIAVEMGEVNIGPTITQYTLKPAEGIKLTKITGLNNDLALALACHPIRIEAPIPGRSLVGIEVPNKTRATVSLRELISQPKFQEASSLVFALGKNVSGTAIFADLEKMPHLLVAGSTGSGKTIFLQSLILSLIYRNSPQILRFILVDPKRVEFPIYNSLPHLLTPVIYSAQKTAQVLNWLIGEMERRFNLLGEIGDRDIQSFNKTISKNSKLKQEYEIMPYIVLIIDELADLMIAKGREIEAGIVRLSQMARAVGIHLVVATQRPSVNIITGLIKANLTSRIAFQATSQVDSRTILDTAGAETLLGRGDMLFLSSELKKPRRIQGCFVIQKEVKKVIDFIVKENQISEKQEIEQRLSEEIEKNPDQELYQEQFDSGEDPLYEQAKQIVLEYKKASASLLQRRLRIGYARAARLLDILEGKGVIGPGEGAKPREVYLNEEENLEEESPEDKII